MQRQQYGRPMGHTPMPIPGGMGRGMMPGIMPGMMPGMMPMHMRLVIIYLYKIY